MKRDFDAEALALVAAELVSKGLGPRLSDDGNYQTPILVASHILTRSSELLSHSPAQELGLTPQTLALCAVKLCVEPFSPEIIERAILNAASLFNQCREELGTDYGMVLARLEKKIPFGKALHQITGANSVAGAIKRFREKLAKYATPGLAEQVNNFISAYDGSPMSSGQERCLELLAERGMGEVARKFREMHATRLLSEAEIQIYRLIFRKLRKKRARSARGTLKKANRAEKKL